jgi:hypothetical protein
MKPNRLLYFLVALILLFLSACATPLKQDQLIPETAQVTTHATGKGIQVGPIIVAEAPKPSWTEPQWQRLNEETFTSAIVDTLDRSGLFSTTSTAGPADYQLSAEVVDQKLVGTMSNIMLLLVRYQLTDIITGNILWTENLLSFHHLSAADVFMGADRVAQVVETAVRQNLQQLVVRLDANLPH